MYYVYMLQSPKADDIYIGFRPDLRRRMREHRSEHRDWRLVYYEAYASEKDARLREWRLKHHGSGKAELKSRKSQAPSSRLQTRSVWDLEFGFWNFLHFVCAKCRRHPFFRSYGARLPSSLTRFHSRAWVYSTHPPVSDYGTGNRGNI